MKLLLKNLFKSTSEGCTHLCIFVPASAIFKEKTTGSHHFNNLVCMLIKVIQSIVLVF